MPIPERVLKRIEKRGECHVWTGAQNNKGYGSISLSKHKTALVHRFIYEQTVGAIPDGLTIDHLCRNKLCVNVEHLEVVTRSENSLRAWRDRAAQTRAAKGIVLPTEEELASERAEQFAVWDAAFGGLLSRHRATTPPPDLRPKRISRTKPETPRGRSPRRIQKGSRNAEQQQFTKESSTGGVALLTEAGTASDGAARG